MGHSYLPTPRGITEPNAIKKETSPTQDILQEEDWAHGGSEA